MLDGWLLHMKEQDTKKKQEKGFAQTRKNVSDNEHFVMARNQEDAQSIREMNDIRGKMIQKQIQAMVKKDGVANEFNIPEIQQSANINVK